MDQMHKSKKKNFWNQQNYYMIINRKSQAENASL